MLEKNQVVWLKFLSIIWCKNRLDCNASDAKEFEDDSRGVLRITNASRRNGGLLHCIAENQYGRAMTSAIHLNFMGKACLYASLTAYQIPGVF